MTAMHSRRPLAAGFLVSALVAGSIWTGCSQEGSQVTAPEDAQFSPPVFQQELLRPAIAVQDRHTPKLLGIPGVVGTAVGLDAQGKPTIKIFTAHEGVAGLPERLDGFPVTVEVTGVFVARTEPTARQPRPVPTGVSVGHPAITAGTIGARVKDVAGNVYILSNNHVLANQNSASIGDPALQPGPYDGGVAADSLAWLYAFEPIKFISGNSSPSNTIDAAIARSVVENLGNATPADDGYGTPGSATVAAYIGQPVQKYGRTTKLTHGTVSELNVTVTVCYQPILIFCLKAAKFVNQIGITPGDFSGGGDSGSLIVTDDANKNPVGLLFAGSETHTLANPIDVVLNQFDVTIDDGGGEPPPAVTDIAITQVSAPATATVGDLVNVGVVVRNVGNQNVTGAIIVSLAESPGGYFFSPQTVSGLAAGASTTLTFEWNTAGASLGAHTLTASHDFSDDNPSNNSGTTTVTVQAVPPPPSEMHVGDLDIAGTGWTGNRWYANVTVRVHDDAHGALSGVLVQGRWTVGSTTYSSSCTTTTTATGAGSCTVARGNIGRGSRTVTFTVTSLSNGLVYNASENHDPDGDSNGTTITVRRPN
jgi:hypothetical protein